MTRRYLFGPVTPTFADANLAGPRRRGECLAFGEGAGLDVAVGPAGTWEEVVARLPEGWRPDFVVLNLSYTAVAEGLWRAPVPIVGLAGDANLLWHAYRRRLPRCDLVLADAAMAEAMAREGHGQVRPAILFGAEQPLLEGPWPDVARDIDVLFVGNLSAAVQRTRLAWLGRLARLAGHRNVVIRTGVFGAEYRALLARAKIGFNVAIRAEANKRAFEIAAAGALLFQEAGNREVPALFRDRAEYVAYTDDDLEVLLEYYLDHEAERAAIAAAGRERVRRLGYEALWAQSLDLVEREWADLAERGRRRAEPTGTAALLGRVWEAVSAGVSDAALQRDLAAALVREPRCAALHNALGVLTGLAGGRPAAEAAAEAAGYFRRAAEADPGGVLPWLNLAEAHAAGGRPDQAVGHARRALDALNRRGELPAGELDMAPYPAGFDLFRVEWERAAWQNAGSRRAEARAKHALARWRAHALCAQRSGVLGEWYEAAAARPDLAVTRAALGCALARAGQPAEAVPHLAAAVEANPFDLQAARALFQALGEAGDGHGQRRLADAQRLLARAAPGVVPEEPWTAKVPPPGDELASIIVLCCNEVAYTRQCLESVLKHTRAPYELVLVDNGSTDGTLGYLEEVASRPGPARVELIRNAENRGFAVGCNQALARSRGRYLVFLNNDTVVTAGWLDGLVRWALHDWPAVGLVGPVTNCAPAPQHVAAGYPELSGLGAFAAHHQKGHAGQGLQVERLTGFCLLVRREVLDCVGGFDEGFGTGFFEDDDLCVRAREAGFGLLVAQDVYVHHFGNRTFQGLGLDCGRLLDGNFERFRAKWGEARVARYRLPGAAATNGVAHGPLPSPTGRGEKPLTPDPSPKGRGEKGLTPGSSPCGRGERMRVSLCMIVRNEEDNLAGCLRSAADLFDEIVVVDTGSTDATREVARAHGARVFEFPWIDDFAAARNASLEHATGDWAFWLDADDRLDEENRARLKELFAGLGAGVAAYAMKCRCLPDPQTGTATVVDHVRLFRNDPRVRWTYRVHEQIVPAVRNAGGVIHGTDIVIAHTGYLDSALRARKQQRDLRLLHLDHAGKPDDAFVLFNLGWAYEELDQPAEALPYLQQSLARSHPSDSIVRKLFTLLMECHRKLGQLDEALAVCQEGQRYYPEDSQLLFQDARLRIMRGDADGAGACLERLLTGEEGPHFASVAEGLRGFKARHQLATLYGEQRRWAEAEAQWQAALAEAPDYVAALLGLGELYARQGRGADLQAVLERLEAQASGATLHAVGLSVLRARARLLERDFAVARSQLEGAIARFPAEVWLWVVLSHALLQEGRDWPAAEAALRRVLELDPGNFEAKSNLAALLRQQGKEAAA